MRTPKWPTLLSIVLLAALPVCAFCSPTVAQDVPSALAATGGFVFTANESGNSVSRIDLTAGTVETMPVSISAHNVQVTVDGQFLLAVGATAAGDHEEMAAGEQSEMDMDAKGLLLIFKTASFSAGPIATIEVGAHPAHVVADPKGKFAFVTNAGDNNVTVVDLASDAATAIIPTGAYPHGQRMSPDGKELYVADVEDGSVSVLDPIGLKELARIPVGIAPVQVGFTPDGRRVYVSLRDENRVAVIDSVTRQIVAKVDVGSGPIQVHATPDGRFVYVANQGTSSEPSDTVSVIEVATNSIIATVKAGLGAHGVAVSNDSAFIFVTNTSDATVSVIDVKTNTVVTTFAVGKGPNGITYQAASR